MKTIEELNSSKILIITFDKKLEKFKNRVFFPEKLAKANEILKKSGLPKIEKK
jgi:hypothetical protein